MRKSGAQRQREYQERKKERQKDAPDLASGFVRSSFSTFLDDDGPNEQELGFVAETLGSVGLDRIDLTKDEDPEWRSEWEGFGLPYKGSLGLAERMVDAFIDSAKTLAGLINQFKLREIENALAELERADLTDPEKRRAALADAARLDALKRRLSKEVRHSFPTTAVKESDARAKPTGKRRDPKAAPPELRTQISRSAGTLPAN